MTLYAIGDVHGQAAMLETALERIEKDGGANAKVVFLGDYVDRGPDSAEVLDILIEGRNEGRDWVFLKGNHDRMFEWFMETPVRQDPHMLFGYHWFHERIGGVETLASYGVEAREGRRLKDIAVEAQEAVPDDHKALLRGFDLMYRDGDLVFVHAGIRPGVALEDQDEEDLLWIRQEFHNCRDDFGVTVVHGHTPVDAPTRYANRINLDSGAGHGHPLTAAVFEGGDCWALTGWGRTDLARVNF